MNVVIPSPCTGVCELDPLGYCAGCHRSGQEIASWLAMHPHERQHLMDTVLPERKARERKAQQG